MKKFKMIIKAEIELELTQEDVEHINNDEDLNGISVKEFYETYYKTEIEDIAKNKNGIKTTCSASYAIDKSDLTDYLK